MPKIECCNHFQECKLFYLKPNEQFRESKLYYLKACDTCGHTVLVLKRVDWNLNQNEFRKTNDKARKLFDKLEQFVDFEFHPVLVAAPKSKFYLHYSEYGTIKKCHSNLSMLKMGLFDNFERTLSRP